MSAPLAHPTVAAVKVIHRAVLAAHGGMPGIRDEALLESAVAAPQATMMGEPLIEDPIEVAASYLFYLCRNHPFVDGNKRVAPPRVWSFSARTACSQARRSTRTRGSA